MKFEFTAEEIALARELSASVKSAGAIDPRQYNSWTEMPTHNWAPIAPAKPGFWSSAGSSIKGLGHMLATPVTAFYGYGSGGSGVMHNYMSAGYGSALEGEWGTPATRAKAWQNLKDPANFTAPYARAFSNGYNQAGALPRYIANTSLGKLWHEPWKDIGYSLKQQGAPGGALHGLTDPPLH